MKAYNVLIIVFFLSECTYYSCSFHFVMCNYISLTSPGCVVASILWKINMSESNVSVVSPVCVLLSIKNLPMLETPTNSSRWKIPTFRYQLVCMRIMDSFCILKIFYYQNFERRKLRRVRKCITEEPRSK